MALMKDYIKGTWKWKDLYAPSEFWKLSYDEKMRITNGCGAANAAIDYVPDTIYGLNISAACDIHDYGYWLGGLKEDKYISDLFLLINTLQIIKQHGGNKLMLTLRYSRAIKYFFAVDFFGKEAFNYIEDWGEDVVE